MHNLKENRCATNAGGGGMRICDLKQKEVINMCDCKRLGYVSDVDFDICTGCILAIIVPGIGRVCGLFGRDTEYIIPFNKIRQVGSDIIIVEIVVEEVLEKCKF